MSELLKFNFEYKEAYTARIEFDTQINEKQKGHEQRYPKWTYPKRVFNLKFDKNFSDRQKLEEFVINVMLSGGKFDWTWEESKGGNGKTYTCFFEDEKFKQNIKNLGYTDCELAVVCIDDSPVVEVGNFDFYHNSECENGIEFNRIIDSIFTAANNMKVWWDKPKRTWTLNLDKDPVTRKKIENFFIAKRGRFRSFDWTWEKERGGDGKTYHVRFDTDTLQMDVDYLGYATFQVQLREVFPNANPLLEVEKDEIIPRKLLEIDIPDGGIRILDNETLDELRYKGQRYLGAPLSHGEITKDDNSSVSKLNITLSNVALGISGIIGNRGDVVTNSDAVLTLVFLDVNTNELITDSATVLYAGKCNNLTLDYENASMDIETPLGGYEKQCPVMKYRATCQVRRFKDCRCGYTGEETACDRTFTRCKELENQANFRGFPTMYEELVIKV
nr:MAG TPA: minor tail protein [Caudoviricetes sp.]